MPAPVQCDAPSRRLVGLLLAFVSLLAMASPAWAQSPPRRHVLIRQQVGDWQVVVTGPRQSAGLEGVTIEAVRGDRRVQAPLDTTATGRLARAVDRLAYYAPAERLLLLTDQAHDRQGLLVVDLRAGTVIDALVGRGMTLSPDGRFVAFEEYYTRLTTPWPWNETVYRVFDVAAEPGAMHRPCPFSDDRCRGHVIHLPDRQQVCADRAARTGGSCLDPHREPQHERRSPFLWIDSRTVALTTVDRTRERITIVTARMADGTDESPLVTAVPCEAVRVVSAGRCPSPRQAWRVDGIRQDDGGRRVWIHFQERLPEVHGGWLALTAGPE
jgi:hypothetical protein